MLQGMSAEPSERSAAAVIRVWLEYGGTSGSLRVRVIERTDLGVRDTRVHPAVTSIDAACEIVRRWLVAFVEWQPSDPLEPAESDAASSG